MAEKIPIGSDHAGFELKEALEKYLRELGYEPEDLGTHDAQSTDYPDYAARVAGLVSRGERRRGVLVCGTGIGMSIAANRFSGVRAAVVLSEELAEISRRHNDSNILALGGRLLEPEAARAILKRWLETEFEGGRHQGRIDKIERHGEQSRRQRD